MIDRVDLFHLEDPKGLAITFYYDTECQDTYRVSDQAQVSEILGMFAAGVEPEHVLIILRRMGKYQLH